MATRVNRAATASTKQGGKSGKQRTRNRTTSLYDRHQSLDSSTNRRAFEAERKETRARRHNVTGNVPTQDEALGVPSGGDYTLKHRGKSGSPQKGPAPRFLVWSHEFENDQTIPRKYTQEGDNLSPPICWRGSPKTSEEFVLVCEDVSLSDRPPLLHWLVYRIPGHVHELPEGIPSGEQVESVVGALQGLNFEGKMGYSGPRPPLYEAWHHYRFRIFALDRNLKGLKPGLTLDEIYKRMNGHVLAEAEFQGRYRRNRGTLKGVLGAA